MCAVSPAVLQLAVSFATVHVPLLHPSSAQPMTTTCGWQVWYGVPANASSALEEAMKDALPDLFEAAPDLMYSLVTMVSPINLQVYILALNCARAFLLHQYYKCLYLKALAASYVVCHSAPSIARHDICLS